VKRDPWRSFFVDLQSNRFFFLVSEPKSATFNVYWKKGDKIRNFGWVGGRELIQNVEWGLVFQGPACMLEICPQNIESLFSYYLVIDIVIVM